MGALVVDKNLDGKLVTITPLRTFELFITAEASGGKSGNPSGNLCFGLATTVSPAGPRQPGETKGT